MLSTAMLNNALLYAMFSSLSSSLVLSTIEYFSYLNLWLIILFLFLCLFFLIFSSCQLLISSILCSGAVFEFSLIFICFLFVVIIISPALIILLDSEIIIIPSFIVYSCGYQWAWTFSFYYLNWISNCDHYLYSSYYLVNGLCYSFIYYSSYYYLSYSLWYYYISYCYCYYYSLLYSVYHLVNQLQYIFIYFLSRSYLFSALLSCFYAMFFYSWTSYSFYCYAMLYYFYCYYYYSFSLHSFFYSLDLLFYIHDSLLILAFFIIFHYLIPLVYGTCISLISAVLCYSLLCFNKFVVAVINLSILFNAFIDILFFNSSPLYSVSIFNSSYSWSSYSYSLINSSSYYSYSYSYYYSSSYYPYYYSLLRSSMQDHSLQNKNDCSVFNSYSYSFINSLSLSISELSLNDLRLTRSNELFYNTSTSKRRKDYSSMNTSLYLNDLSSLNTYLFYFFTCNTTILIPILSTIRFFVFSYDVIHSLGIYSFGIKIDAIPGRFNFTSTIRTLIKSVHYGYCYELCGHGHSSMLIVVKTLFLAT